MKNTKIIPGINDQKIIDRVYNILEDKEPIFKRVFINDVEYKQYEFVFASYKDIILTKLTTFLQGRPNLELELELLHNIPDWDYDTLIVRIAIKLKSKKA